MKHKEQIAKAVEKVIALRKAAKEEAERIAKEREKEREQAQTE